MQAVEAYNAHSTLIFTIYLMQGKGKSFLISYL